MARHDASVLVGHPPVANQHAFARGGQDVNAAIYAQDLAGQGQRLRTSLALKACIPPGVFLDDPSASERRNFTAFARLDRTQAGHDDALADESERLIAVRERQLLPTRSRLESREAGRFAARLQR